MEASNYIVQIQEILRAKEWSQTRLAQALDVTHATLNRWLHQKATPHPQKVRQISDFHQQVAFYSRLESGVDGDLLRQRFTALKRDIPPLTDLLRRRDLVEDCLLRLTYHTNKIEGSTLSLRETQTVLFDNRVIQDHPLVEHLEVSNHSLAFSNMLQAAQLELSIDMAFIKSLHRSLMSGILEQAGFFRTHPVRIVGSRTVPCNFLKIEDRMMELCGQMDRTVDPIGMIMQHAWFEAIHPFSDGNGRMGRLLLNYQLLRSGYPPIIIRSERKDIYYDSLERAQTKDEYAPLLEFCLEELRESGI